MKFRQTILLLIALSMAAALVACSSSSTTPPPAISVGFSATPPASLQINATQSLTATVSNDSASAGVTWSVTCGTSGACGSFSPTSTGSGTATTYTAPSAVPSGNTVTVKATSVTDSSKSAAAIITITAPASVAVTLSPAPSFLQVGGGAGFTAFVSNDAANAGVTWAVTCGSSGCGSLSAASTASGAATDFTAPATVPTGNTVTITATSVTDVTKSASAVVTVTSPLTTLADGTYVFSLAGQDIDNGGSPYFVAGAFTLASGTITGGEQDFADYYALTLKNAITGGSMTTTADGNLQITLNTDDTSGFVGVAGTETLNAVLVSGSRALISEFDSSGGASGTLNLQTSATAPAGGYAFFVTGVDYMGCPASFGGVLNVDGTGTISGTGSVFDLNDCGSGASFQGEPIDASTVSGPDAFGRIQLSVVMSTSGVGGIGLVGYVRDATHISLVENSNDVNDVFFGTVGGTAFGQGANTGTFNTASVAGSSFVFEGTGADVNFYSQVAGVLTTNSDGTTVSGMLNFNDLTGTAAQTPVAVAGTYTVDATGRVTLLNLTDGANFTVNAQLYLDGHGKGTVATMDGTDVLAGLAYQQTGEGAFSAASLFGTYGLTARGIDVNYLYELDAVGAVMADGVGALTGVADLNPVFGAPTAGVALTGTFTANASGVFSDGMAGLDVVNPSNADAFTYYLIDTTGAVAIETDPNQLTVGYLELQQ